MISVQLVLLRSDDPALLDALTRLSAEDPYAAAAALSLLQLEDADDEGLAVLLAMPPLLATEDRLTHLSKRSEAGQGWSVDLLPRADRVELSVDLVGSAKVEVDLPLGPGQVLRPAPDVWLFASSAPVDGLPAARAAWAEDARRVAEVLADDDLTRRRGRRAALDRLLAD